MDQKTAQALWDQQQQLLNQQETYRQQFEKQQADHKKLLDLVIGAASPDNKTRAPHKLPPFNTHDPELWFSVAEVKFIGSQVTTDEEKYALVVEALDPATQNEVRDLILNPPQHNKYTTLKDALIKRLGATQEEKTRRLLEREEIGDRKPSQFLRHLQGLAGKTLSDDILRTLWIDRLPQNVQAILATQKSTPLDQVADLADAIISYNRPNSVHVNEMSNQNVDKQLSVQMAQLLISLQEEVSTLRREVAAIHTHSSRPRSRDRLSTPFRRRSRSRSRGSTGTCWYHRKFGSQAQKCQQPCNFKSENAMGSH